MPSRPLVHLGLALAGFALGALAVRGVLGTDRGERTTLTLAHLGAHREDYDAVWIGSSHLLRGLDPRIVDAELTRAGVPLKSFNLGADGMRALEGDALLRRVLALGSRRLRWIVLEAAPLGLTRASLPALEEEAHVATARRVAWHGPAATWRALRSLAPLGLSLGTRLDLALGHASLLARNLTNLGILEGLVSRGRWRPSGAREFLLATRGFQPILSVHAKGFAPYLDEPERFTAAVCVVDAQNQLPIPRERLEGTLPAEQQALAVEHGVRLVFLTLPCEAGSPEALRLHEAGRIAELIHLDDPKAFPELFQADERFDLGHLNRAGARRLSLVFAHEWLRRIAEDPPPAR